MRGIRKGWLPDRLGNLLQEKCSGHDHRAGDFHASYFRKIRVKKKNKIFTGHWVIRSSGVFFSALAKIQSKAYNTHIDILGIFFLLVNGRVL
jgi:hypothetical protein